MVKRIMTIAIPLAAALLAVARFTVLPALADEQDLDLLNNSGLGIDETYVSPSDSPTWGLNVLSERLSPGDSRGIVFQARSGACDYDIRVLFDTGAEADLKDQDLCTTATLSIDADDITIP